MKLHVFNYIVSAVVFECETRVLLGNAAQFCKKHQNLTGQKTFFNESINGSQSYKFALAKKQRKKFIYDNLLHKLCLF